MKVYKQYKLDPFQSEALKAIKRGESVIVAAPTGAGKTLIAEFAIEKALEAGKRIVYTAPIKALSNQKYRDFSLIHGDRVGLLTGDVTLNPGGDLLIMTTEVFRNTIFEDASQFSDVAFTILDEAHFLDDRDRGTVWEESIIFAPPNIRFICLSATISNLDQFAAWMRKIRKGDLTVVLEEERPVPLHPVLYIPPHDTFLEMDKVKRLPSYKMSKKKRRKRWRKFKSKGQRFMANNLRLIKHIKKQKNLPCIFFLFSRNKCEKMAHAAANHNFVSKAESRELTDHFDMLADDFELSLEDPDIQSARRIIKRGVAYHHAGMLPTVKEVVERLFTSGLVKLLFATSTFALGVNMPARSVAFEDLRKFNGIEIVNLTTREFQQMAGRAGRRGIDSEGHAYVPVQPAEDRPQTLSRIIGGTPEPVRSRFNPSYSAILSLYDRLGDELFTAFEKSFLRFQVEQAGKKGQKNRFDKLLELVRLRLEVLEQCSYIEGGTLTSRGRFASLVYGFEIPTTQFLFSGLLHALDTHGLNVLFASVIHESKPRTWARKLKRSLLKPLKRQARSALREFVDRELKIGIEEPVRRLDFQLSAVADAWSRGATFEEICQMTDLSGGDIIRCFRMTVQIHKQVLKTMKTLRMDEPELADKLVESSNLMRRGMVDAERQLKLGLEADIDEAEEFAEAVPS